ncbi:CitB protein [Salmonella enterica subsp. enterica]|uniref:CitB protein n=1 Tax=Salmonella enterica I TaxID=59201 RepID=A0A379WQ91_SALET|nr:CitB protein [Salmonella enterica subsp. enterica]
MPHFCYVTLSEKSVQTSIQLQGVFCFLSQRVVLSLSIVQLMTRLSQVLLLTHALIRVKFTRLTMWQIWTISALKTIIILIKLRRYSMPEVTPFQVLIVDDHPLMRRGIRQLLELDPAFYVVAKRVTGRVRSIWRIALSPI